MNQQQQQQQQVEAGHRVYTEENVCYALAHSLIPGVLRMVPDQPFYVIASQWKKCLTKISQLCSVSWIHKRKNNGVPGGSVVYSETFHCYHASSG